MALCTTRSSRWSQETVHRLQHHRCGGGATHQITSHVSRVVDLTDTEAQGARVTLGRDIHNILWSCTRLEFFLDRGTGRHARLIEMVSGVRRSPNHILAIGILGEMGLIFLVDLHTHFGPHVQIIVDLVLAQGLVDFGSLLVDLAVVNVLALVFGGRALVRDLLRMVVRDLARVVGGALRSRRFAFGVQAASYHVIVCHI